MVGAWMTTAPVERCDHCGLSVPGFGALAHFWQFHAAAFDRIAEDSYEASLLSPGRTTSSPAEPSAFHLRYDWAFDNGETPDHGAAPYLAQLDLTNPPAWAAVRAQRLQGLR